MSKVIVAGSGAIGLCTALRDIFLPVILFHLLPQALLQKGCSGC